MAGPFGYFPLADLKFSPLGFVPKRNPFNNHLIHYQSYRISELVAKTQQSVAGLLCHNVQLLPNLVRCYLWKSNTNQEHCRMLVDLNELMCSRVRPVWCIRELLEVRLEGCRCFVKLVFFHFQFVAIFRKCLAAAVLASSNYSLHSFCISAAMEAAHWRLCAERIESMGHWESELYYLYVRPHPHLACH